jgi:hypothetical protein
VHRQSCQKGCPNGQRISSPSDTRHCFTHRTSEHVWFGRRGCSFAGAVFRWAPHRRAVSFSQLLLSSASRTAARGTAVPQGIACRGILHAFCCRMPGRTFDEGRSKRPHLAARDQSVPCGHTTPRRTGMWWDRDSLLGSVLPLRTLGGGVSSPRERSPSLPPLFKERRHTLRVTEHACVSPWSCRVPPCPPRYGAKTVTLVLRPFVLQPLSPLQWWFHQFM